MGKQVESEIRRKLLEMFTTGEEEYVSGQKISDELGCSRTAVWKHIEDLRKDGYELEAVRRKGYKLIKKPELVTPDALRLGLDTKKLGQNICYRETVDSTQKVAHRLAQEGCEEGTLVIAEEQVGGRGRLNRAWHSPKTTGIWMSLVLRPQIPPHEAPQLTLLAAVAIVQAIEDITNIKVDIKWPNDILINGKKLVGILTEMQADADQIHSVIIGMGINVNQQGADFNDELSSIATSLSIEKGEKISRATLVQAILKRLEELYYQYLKAGFAPIKILWEAYAITIGRNIIARTLKGSIEGLAKGITPEGTLMLEDLEGKMHYIYSADIELSINK